MVQPQPDGALQWDMSGDDSGGALRVPPELAANEVVTRLLGDNQQLRDALRRSNHALRQRCEEMEGWQRKTREDREFLSCRFQEARALVERLAQENHSLQGLVNGPASSSSYCSSSSQTEGPFPTKNGPLDATQIPDKQEKKKVEEADQHTQTTPPRSLLVEGAIDVLQVKSHKEKLEEGMRELKRKNEELEKQRDEGEKERERMRRCIDQLWAKLSQAQASNATEEAGQHRTEAQHSSDCSSLAKLTEQLQATQGRYRELEEKLDYLQKSSAQRDRTEALLKQKDKDCEALKAQATSLLAELNERQSCLDKSEQERKIMEDKLCSKAKALQVAEQDLEQQRNQHHVNKDKLMLQIQSLEQALKTERHVVTVEKKKLTQLQHAYTCLFRDYDAILKSEGGDLCSRLEEAERALALKQDLIDKLKEEVEQQKGSLETVPVLTAQAEIYKADFLAEREAREKLNQKKEELQDQLTHALAEIDRQKQEAASRVRMEQMKLRHQDDFPARVPHITPPQGGFSAGTFNTAPPPSIYRNPGMVQAGDQGAVGVEDLPDLCCPKCQYHAPDMDTLQIHVMDCIQ
ncbi:NF-kappa-B essential modulator isoform X5 [Corythoichthys intestinalis]|uniref:NF-kappa-B essential modulator isoform X5 n=1 Tax=Corythoichthys intestinalis TaxID=161448 RepID=UPI0025A67AE3|nr:NF-kappa-B essential modulator isoform X5 [Corythoichthys intestinalis]XP_061802606.1 NF-kappa-B essential modulator-like [Nerophis lumbriciformis]